MTVMATCANCRSVLSAQDKFCQRCGAQASPAGTEWYYATPQGQVGPVPTSTIAALLRSGSLNASSLVWTEGLANWSSIAQTPLATILSAPAPSPEIVSPYAGFGIRVGAYLIDTVIAYIISVIFVMIIAVVLVASGVNADRAGSMMQFIGFIVGIVVTVFYFAIMESSATRATLGKLMCKIYVTDERGARIGFMRALGRYFAKYLSSIPLGIGYIVMIHDPRRQTWHDRLASTYVLKK